MIQVLRGVLKLRRGPASPRRRTRKQQAVAASKLGHVVGLRVWGFGFRVSGFGFRVWGLGFRALMAVAAREFWGDPREDVTFDQGRDAREAHDGVNCVNGVKDVNGVTIIRFKGLRVYKGLRVQRSKGLRVHGSLGLWV